MDVIETELLEYPSERQLKIIHCDLKINVSKLEENELMFDEWLKEQDHLPKNYDKQLVRNFIRLCKNNLDRAKSKYENYIKAKSTIPELFEDRFVYEDSFKDSLSHKSLTIIPNLTADCYRILLLKIPKDNMIGADFNECLKYLFLNADFGLANTAEAGHICIFDCSGFSLSYARQMSLTFLRRTIYLILKVYPSRLKEIHLLNVNTIVSVCINIAKTFLTEKLKNRIRVHKNPTDLLNFLPDEYVPLDYGGTAKHSEEISESWRRFFIQNRSWIEKNQELKLINPNPSES